MSFPKSLNVALVPNASGQASGAGTMPTADVNGLNFNQFTFTDLPVADINSTALSNFDTVVLLQVCDVNTALTQNQKNDINAWINNGGKLIIYDSDACSGQSTPDYSWLVYPFITNNPGQQGSQSGNLIIVENNTLGSNNINDQYYIDVANIEASTDAVGDANVMITSNPNWYGHMEATNVNNITGWVHTYATYGSGLLIYNGLDTDDIGQNINLQKIWLFELLQEWDPDGLPHGHPVASTPCSVCTPKITQVDIPVCSDKNETVTGIVCNGGRILELNVKFDKVCPRRSIALAVIVRERDGSTIGMQFCKIEPQQSGTNCVTRVIGPLKFPIISDSCDPKTVFVEVIANYDN